MRVVQGDFFALRRWFFWPFLVFKERPRNQERPKKGATGRKKQKAHRLKKTDALPIPPKTKKAKKQKNSD
jgi:hypothetical protein